MSALVNENNRSHKVIKYYMDPDLTTPAPLDQEGNILLKFGTVLQGRDHRIKLYANNTIEYDIALEPILEENEPDLNIVKYPSTLRAGSTEEVIISFKPDLDRVKPLESGVDFRKIILTRS